MRNASVDTKTNARKENLKEKSKEKQKEKEHPGRVIRKEIKRQSIRMGAMAKRVERTSTVESCVIAAWFSKIGTEELNLSAQLAIIH